MYKIFVSFLLSPFMLMAQNVMTAEEAIKIGLKNNYNIQIARNDKKIAHQNANKGRSGFLPIMDATGQYQLASSDETTNNTFSVGTSDTRNLNGQISLNWTLFDGFKMFADKRRYNELARLGDSLARDTIENQVLTILSAYFDLVQQEQLLDVAKNTLDIYRKVL